jgi:methyl-accepting chemotaxis protein
MKQLRFKLYAYRNRLVPMFMLIMVPWLTIAPWAPWWLLSISIPLLFISAWLLLLHVLPMPPAMRRTTDDRKVSDAEIARLRKAADGDAQQLFVRMASVTRESKAQLEEVDQQVTEVMTHAESAVIEIGKRFVEVTRKTRRQVELAVGLLSNTRSEAEAGKAAESLTDYIHASDALLQDLGKQLSGLGAELASLAARQEAVREDSKKIDGALDQLAGLASQIRVLALDSSRRGSSDNRAFVEMTDRVRDLSMNADESARAIRRILEDIKANAGSTDNAIRALAMQARDAGRKSNEQVTELTGATLTKMQEVNEALGEIGDLGERIQADINQIVIELQFQDITQQKLQRLKAPILTELASSWLAMFEETRAFNGRLAKGEKPELQPTHFRVSRKGGPEQPDKPRSAPQPAPGGAAEPRRDDDNKVELF